MCTLSYSPLVMVLLLLRVTNYAAHAGLWGTAASVVMSYTLLYTPITHKNKTMTG
jgi:hypothetical protein